MEAPDLSVPSVILQSAILAVSLFFLVRFSDIISDASVRLSRITKLGEMAVGFLLLSVITSLPELAVTVSAIRSGDPGISIGGLLGSNVANIGLVLGLTAILAPTTVTVLQESYKKLSLMIFLSAFPPIFILPFGEYGSSLGISLLFIFMFFCLYSVKSQTTVKDSDEAIKGSGLRRDLLFFFGGLVIVILSARFVVDSAVNLSKGFGISETIIGATIIAVGTSLPELSVSLSAARKNHMNLALGNILGSCIVNLTLLLGLVFTLSSLTLNLTVFSELILFLMVADFALWRMIIDGRIGVGEGLILLFLYLIFLASTFGLQVLILSPEYLMSMIGVLISASMKILAYGFVGILALVLGWILKRG